MTGICDRCGRGFCSPTKAQIEAAVEGLFTASNGERADCLALLHGQCILSMGDLSPADVVEHLCRALGVEQ